MKRNALLAGILALSLFFTPLAAHSEETPKVMELMNARLVASTDPAEYTAEVDLEKKASALGGNFSVQVEATSDTGDADVTVFFEIWNEASGEWQTSWVDTGSPPTTYGTELTASTLTQFASEGS